jgi:hypothetical protein
MRRLVRDHSCRLWAFGAFLVIWLEGPGLGRAQAFKEEQRAHGEAVVSFPRPSSRLAGYGGGPT